MTPALQSSDIAVLERSVRGRVISRTSEDYDSARRIWNAMISRRPGAIVRAAGVADVIASVNFARDRDLPLAIRGGGHNVAGNALCDNGIVIDLSAMQSVRVDPGRRTARA